MTGKPVEPVIRSESTHLPASYVNDCGGRKKKIYCQILLESKYNQFG